MKKIALLSLLTLISIFLLFWKLVYRNQDYSLPQVQKQTTLTEPTQRPKLKFDHIVVIVMENKPEDQIIGSNSAPFINSLVKNCSLAGNYYAITHPSLPNYLTLIGGSTFDITSDCENCYQDKKNLVDSLENAHKSWKAYMESMPSPCFVGSKDSYAMKHNPFIYFNDIRLDKNQCQNIVPLDELDKDLSDTAKAPNFIWITPNLCHDMHDCSVTVGDSWLAQQIPMILNSPAFQQHNSLLTVTFDEGEGNDNKVATILVGPSVKKGYVSQARYDHYSLLHTIESNWNLPSLTENDKNAPIMDEFFK